MVASAMTRRDALAALGAFGLSLTGAASSARAQSGLRFRDIVVNVEPLRARDGDPTAAWMDQALGRRCLGRWGLISRRATETRAILEVRIDWIYLAPSSGGPGPRGSAQDTMIGSFVVRGPRGGIASVIPLRAIASYYPRPSIRRSSSEPITGASSRSRQTFAGWAPRELGL